MNCESCERLILLEQTGELGGREQRRMGEHIAGCHACQAYRQGLEPLRVEVHAALDIPPVTNVLLKRIHEALAADAPNRAHAGDTGRLHDLLRPRVWIPLAAAASLALLAGLQILRPSATADSAATADASFTPMYYEMTSSVDQALDAMGHDLFVVCADGVIRDEDLFPEPSALREESEAARSIDMGA